MRFYDIVNEVIALLQREGRVSYRALKREFTLDNDYLEDLKAELIEAKRLGSLIFPVEDSPYGGINKQFLQIADNLRGPERCVGTEGAG